MSFRVSTEKKSTRLAGSPRQKCWLLLALMAIIWQSSYGQDRFPALTTKISYVARQVTAERLFDELQKQSGFSFLFDRTAFKAVPMGDVSYTDKPLGDVLTALQKKYGFLFSVAGKNVAVKQGRKPVPKGTGKVAGKITDEENSQPVFGATVRFGSEGTVTDIDGNFNISLPEGNYAALVSYIGYGAKEISQVVVKPGELFELNITIKRAKGTLAGVVVKGDARRETSAALLVKQKNSTAITDGISSELIRRTPDRNAGDAIKRVTGVSVLEGKYVVVRGLADRYNYSMLNGGILPSTEPDRRTFSLDLIPALAIESIVVTKTATADLPGEFAGGVVQVTTKDFPEQNFISLSLGTGFYASQTGKPFFKDVNGSKDWWGKDDGTRAIPASLNMSAGDFLKLAPENRFNISSGLSRYWAPVQDGNAQPVQSVQVGYGKTITFPNSTKLGIIALGNYRRDQTIDRAERYDLAQYTKYRGTTGPGDTLAFMRSFPDETGYRFVVNKGALLNIAYQFGKNKVSLKSMFNQDFETVTTLKSGEKTMGNGFGDIVDARGVDMHPTQKTLLGTQLQGEHRFGEENAVQLTWNVAYNKVKKYEPNQSRLGYLNFYRLDTVNNKDQDYFVPEFGTIETGSRLYSNLEEDAYNVNFAVATPFKVATQPQLLKAGAYTQFRKRTYHTRNLGYFDAARGVTPPPNDNSGFPSPVSVDFNQPIDDILSPVNFRPGGLVVVSYELPANEYTGGANLASAFVNMESNLLKQLRLIYGARVEFYAMSLSTNKKLLQALPGSGGETQPPIDYIRYDTDVLPSASLIYNPIPTVNVRAAWSKTLTRPEFREISPYEYFDFVSGYTTKGNPDLKKGTVKNLDFRVEWFPAAGEIISASVFKKDLRHPVELTSYATTSTGKYIRFYKNIDEAEIRGIEFEVRKSLYFGAGPEWLRNIILFGNYARISSKIKGKVEGWEGRPDVDQYVKERPLMGQSPYLLNGGVLINALENTFSFSAALNRVGRRIVVVGTTSEDRTEVASYPDIYENPRNQLDIQVAQKLFKQKLELRVNAANLLNDAFVQYQDFDLNRKYSGNTFDATVYSRKSYRQFTFTLSYTFKK